MTRTFIQTDEFAKNWKKLHLGDDLLRKLELTIMKNPSAGVLIQGTGGLRKLRMAYPNRGKSGSFRVCYVDFLKWKTVYLITVYAKNEMGDLSDEKKNRIKKAIEMIEERLDEQNGGT